MMYRAVLRFSLLLCTLLLVPARAVADDDARPSWHYAVTANGGLRGGPVVVRDSIAGSTRRVWHHATAYGFRIEENWKGPIYYLNKVWFAVLTMGRGYDPNTGQEVVTAYDVGGRGGSWYFDFGDNYLRAGFDSRLFQLGNSHLDLGLGIWGFRAFENDSELGALDPAGQTATFLRDANARFLVRNGGIELAMLRFRYALTNWPGGSVLLGEDFSIINAFVFPYLPFASPEFNDTIWGFGIPRTSLTITQDLGPLVLRARGSVPNAVLVVPWYIQGAEVVVEAGLRL